MDQGYISLGFRSRVKGEIIWDESGIDSTRIQARAELASFAFKEKNRWRFKLMQCDVIKFFLKFIISF